MRILALLLLLSPQLAIGCSVDADCAAGSQCVKPYGQPDGICKGGPSHGNQGYGNPANPAQAKSAADDRCSSDSECGPDSRCAKGRGQSTGVCVNRRDR